MKQQIIVSQLTTATRLDKFLVANLEKFSRSFIQQTIKQGKILVNKKKVTVHHFLKNGDIISLNFSEPKPISVIPTTKIPLEIIKETPDFLIINKPEGLVVHPAPGVNEPTLVDGLIVKFPKIKNLGEDPLRPGIVHRLDRDVSGLIIVAITPAMFEHLKRQFKNHLIHKEYTGLVNGQVQLPSGIIDFPLGRSRTKHGKIAARPKGGEGEPAITKFEVMQKFTHTTLLKIQIITGRTHQIRAHLAAFGYPLVGDKIYKPTKIQTNKKIGRLFLHASYLEFTDLDGNQQKFSSPLPDELNLYLETLH
ncbi:MAG: RluA family pseudouridine synthase [Patescibacteria group bacterium]